MKMGKITDLKTLILAGDKERPAATVKKLTLDGAKAEDLSAVSELLESHSSLQCLSLVAVGLTSLHGLPQLPSLRRLYVCDNRLSGSLDVVAEQCLNLQELYLGGNQRIKNIEVLAPLKSLRKLQILDVFDCGLMQNAADNYRDAIRECLPQLQIVDGLDANGQDFISDDEEDSDHEEEDYTDTSSDDEEDEGNEENDCFIEQDTPQYEVETEDENGGGVMSLEQPAANGRRTLKRKNGE